MNTTFKEEAPVAPERRAFEPTPAACIAAAHFEEVTRIAMLESENARLQKAVEELNDKRRCLESEASVMRKHIGSQAEELLKGKHKELDLLDRINALMDKHIKVCEDYADCLRAQAGMPKE